MSIVRVPIAPPKGRWPKDPHKRAVRRYQLDAAKAYKAAMKTRNGSSGKAGPCRRLDPETLAVVEIVKRGR
jgi:hypothetical protein